MWQQNTKVRSLIAGQHLILLAFAQLPWVKEASDVLSAAGLTLPLVDALAYAEEKGELFGHHARNVYHVATQVSLHFALTVYLHPHSQSRLPCRLLICNPDPLLPCRQPVPQASCVGQP